MCHGGIAPARARTYSRGRHTDDAPRHIWHTKHHALGFYGEHIPLSGHTDWHWRVQVQRPVHGRTLRTGRLRALLSSPPRSPTWPHEANTAQFTSTNFEQPPTFTAMRILSHQCNSMRIFHSKNASACIFLEQFWRIKE